MKTILFSFFLISSVMCQSTVDSLLRYYPFTVGNKWVYQSHDQNYYFTEVRIVTGDTVINSNKYFVLRNAYRYDNLGDYEFYRFDTVTKRIIHRYGNGLPEKTYDSLISATSFSNGSLQVISFPADSFFSRPVPSRMVIFTGDNTLQYAYDVGLKNYWYGSANENSKMKLIYAKVNGTEYQKISIDSLLGYFPMQAGNLWIYGATGSNKLYQTKILGDSIINGKKYKIFHTPDPLQWRALACYRIDSANGLILKLSSDAQREEVIDSLLCPIQWGWKHRKLDSVTTEQFGSIITNVRYVTEKIIPTIPQIGFAHGIGIVFSASSEEYGDHQLMRRYFSKLVYANIGGKEIGSKAALYSDSLALYHPLNNGDKWIYRTIRSNYPLPSTTTDFVKEVLGDTLLSNAVYKKIQYRDLSGRHISYAFERFDAVTGNYIRYAQTPQVEDSTFTVSPNAIFGQFRSRKLVSVTTDSILGVTGLTREVMINNVVAENDWGWRYMYGLGLVEEYIKPVGPGPLFSGSYTVLLYAKINGKEYGNKPQQKLIDSLSHFYPLHVGNMWVLKSEASSLVNIESIIKDTVMGNGKVYAVRLRQTKDSADGIVKYQSVSYERLDSATGQVFTYSDHNEFQIDSLLSNKGDTVKTGLWKPIYLDNGSANYFGSLRRYKTIKIRFSPFEMIKTYAWDLGTTKVTEYIYMDEYPYYLISSVRYNLVYAKINGKEYSVDPKKQAIDSLALYHPLHAANKWIYKRNSVASPSYYAGMYISREVAGDTVFDNITYQKILEYNSKDGLSMVSVERFDSITGNFYQGFPHGVPGTNVDYSLADSTSAVALNTSFRSGKLTEIRNDTILGRTTRSRTILTLGTIDVAIQKRYSYGFGMTLEKHTVMESFYDSLVYASIDGIEYGTKPLSVDDKRENKVPTSYSLSQNYPNPFNPSTIISYQLPARANVILKVFSTIGKEIAVLVNQQQEPGRYSVQFNGSSLASGVYFYRIQAGGFNKTGKMILSK